MTGHVLLWRARIDDADDGIVHTFREPFSFSQEFGVSVATLMHRDVRHYFSPPHEIVDD